MIFLVAFFMTLVYCYVRGLDNKMDRYTSTYRKEAARASKKFEMNDQKSGSDTETDNSKRRGPRMSISRTFSNMKIETLNEQRRLRRYERSKAVANQGLFYAGTFALVWLFGTIVRGMQLAGLKPPWTIIFLFAVFTPSQGFFNFLVYIRPRLIKYFNKRKRFREGRLSTDNSSVLHVSAVSGVSRFSSASAGSQNEGSGEKETRESNSSEMMIKDPYMKAMPEGSEPSKKTVHYLDCDTDAKTKPDSDSSDN
jgi:hypothetical protein